MGIILPTSAQAKLLKKFGVNAKIYFSKLCTCMANNNGVPDPNCRICKYGFIYDEKNPEEIELIRTAVRMHGINERMAFLYEGGCRITIFKKDLMKHVVHSAYNNITKGDVIVINTDERRDRDFCKLGSKDTLLAFDVKRVISVSETSKDLTKETIFRLGEDYEVIIESGVATIKWLDEGNKPDSFYAVDFVSGVNYLVWDDLAKDRGGSDSELPKMVMCRLRPYYDPNKPIVLDVNTDYPATVQVEEGTASE